jgi:hypothetical protein
MHGLIAAMRGRAARGIGFIASVTALAFFLRMFFQTVSLAELQDLLVDHSYILSATLGLYCLTYVLMAQAWAILAKACGARSSSGDLKRIFLTSQIAKYLPGNVAQFIGRAWAGQALGIPLKSLGMAMALEIAGVLAACSILALLTFTSGLIETAGQGHQRFIIPIAVGLAAIGALIGATLALYRSERQTHLVAPLLLAIACYLFVLSLLAIGNILLIGALTGDMSWALAGRIAGAFIVSWLVGFVTPGSPAGLGLREVTFFSLLAGSYSSETLILSATAFRLATISGDLLAWIAGMLMKPSRVPQRTTA